MYFIYCFGGSGTFEVVIVIVVLVNQHFFAFVCFSVFCSYCLFFVYFCYTLAKNLTTDLWLIHVCIENASVMICRVIGATS